MRVIVDVDGVVADLVGAMLQIGGRTDRSEAFEYDWFKKYPEPAKSDIGSAMINVDFWMNLPLMPQAKEGIEFLRSNGHKIVWCTAPYRSCFGWESARRIWLEKNFNIRHHGDAYVPTHDKYLVQGLAFIDDRTDLVEAWEKENRGGVGLIYRSEMNLNSGHELVTWEDIMNMEFFNGSKFRPAITAGY